MKPYSAWMLLIIRNLLTLARHGCCHSPLVRINRALPVLCVFSLFPILIFVSCFYFLLPSLLSFIFSTSTSLGTLLGQLLFITFIHLLNVISVDSVYLSYHCLPVYYFSRFRSIFLIPL